MMISTQYFTKMIATAALTLACLSATAAPKTMASPTTSLPAFEEIDRDGNGVVTMPEVDVYPDEIAARLRKCDLDRDMQVTPQEYVQCEQDAHKTAKK